MIFVSRPKTAQQRMSIAGALLIFAIWLTHSVAIDTFPPFIDELIHIHGSEQGYTQSPLANAILGRQFTFWWLMLFQVHLGSPIWLGRVVTLLAVLPGVAAAMGIGRLAAGMWGLALAGLLYLFSAYHFFFGRLALADPIAGSAVLIAIYFGYRLSRRFKLPDAVMNGVFLFLAVGAKISTLPYLGVPLAAALVFKGRRPWRSQTRWTAQALITAGILISGYVVGLRLFGYDVFSNSVSYALTNRGAASASSLLDLDRIRANLQFTLQILSGYLGAGMVALLLVSVAVLCIRRRFYLPLCFAGPLIIIVMNQVQESRFLFIPAGLLLVCGALVLADLVQHQKPVLQMAGLSIVFAWGIFQWLPFAVTAGEDPLQIPLPAADFAQYLRSDASGYGLEAVRQELVARDATEVIGLLSNCQALRYVSLQDFQVTCPNLLLSGENIDALTELMEAPHTPGTFVVLETLPFVPESAPGARVALIKRPDGGPTLSIFDLSNES